MINSIRIGITSDAPPRRDQSNNSISINATGSFTAPSENSCIIKPIRDASNEDVTFLGYHGGEIVQTGKGFTPLGIIIPYAVDIDLSGDSVEEPIHGWLWCNGAIGLNDVKYQDLSGALGSTYGSPGRLPDLRGRTIFGDLAEQLGGGTRSSLAIDSAAVGTGDDGMMLNQLPSHEHDMTPHTHSAAGVHHHLIPAHTHSISHTHTVPFYDGTDDGGPGFGNADDTGGPHAIAGMNTTTTGGSSAANTGESPSTTSDVPTGPGESNPTGGGGSYIPPAVVLTFLIKY